MNEINNIKILNEVSKCEVFPTVLEKLIVDYLPNIKINIYTSQEIDFYGEYTKVYFRNHACAIRLKTIYTNEGDNRCFIKGFYLSSLKNHQYQEIYYSCYDKRSSFLFISNILGKKMDTAALKSEDKFFQYFYEEDTILIKNHYVCEYNHNQTFCFMIRKDIYHIIQSEINYIRDFIFSF